LTPQALLFGSEAVSNRPISRKTFYRQWKRAVTATEMEGFRFHDLRHTANTLTALTGASAKELMARMGHASSRAALIYLHATPQRDREIATAPSKVISASRPDPSGNEREALERLARDPRRDQKGLDARNEASEDSGLGTEHLRDATDHFAARSRRTSKGGERRREAVFRELPGGSAVDGPQQESAT